MLIDGPYFYNASGTGSFTGSFKGDGSQLENLPWGNISNIPSGIISSSDQIIDYTSSVSSDLINLTPYQILYGNSSGNIGQSTYHSINNENFNSEVVKVGRQLVVTGSIVQYSNSTTYSPRVIYNPTSLYLNGNNFGAIVLKLPQSWTNTMIVFKLDGFEYRGNRSNWSATISGYNYTGPYWSVYNARIDGAAPFNRVRLGHDGKNCILILGNTSTKWISTKIVLSKVIASHYNTEKWIPSGSLTSEYNFYITGSTSGFSSIVEPTIYQYQSSASGYFGYGTTNPQSKIHVDSGDIRVTNGGFIGDGSGLYNIPTSSISNWGQEVSRSAAYYGFAGNTNDWGNITNIPSGLISSSNQISGLDSSSISNFNSGIQTYIEANSFAYKKAQFITCSYENAGVTYDWDMVDKPILKLNLTASLTFNNPTNKRSIQSGLIHILQDGTGGHTLAFSSDFKGRNDNDIPSIITTALSASSIFYYTDGTYVYLSS